MRKLVLIAFSILLVAGAAFPASGEPNVRRDEEAFADWLLPTGQKNEFKWLGAYVSRSTVLVGAADWFSFAGFAKGRCVREKTPEYVSISCDSTDFIQADPAKDFEMSPLASDATLRVRSKGRTHVARWAAAPAGGTYVMSEYCFSFEPGEEEAEEQGEGHGGGIWNPAAARGRFFGHRFGESTPARWSALATGVMVTTCSFRSVDFDPAAGSLHVTYRIPR